MIDFQPSWIPQAISILGMAFQVLSFQFKKAKTLFILQGIGCAFFVVSFMLIKGGFNSALVNLVGVAQYFLFGFDKHSKQKRGYIIAIGVALLSVTVLSWISAGFTAMSLIIFFASIVGLIATWTDSSRIIRLSTLCVVAPVWIVNSIIYFSLGGLLTQVFAILSIVISIIRYGWKGLDK